MHREALKLLLQLVEESKSDRPRADLTQKFTPEMIIDYLKVTTYADLKSFKFMLFLGLLKFTLCS